MNDCLVLLGVKHAGKTTVGQIFAERRNLPFFDIDSIIEQQAGKSCRNIYNQEGVAAFQNAETEACRFFIEALSNLILNTKIKGVVAGGGGICDNPVALDILHKVGLFVYLEVPNYIAFERIITTSKKKGSFPAYLARGVSQADDDIKKTFYQIYEKRAVSYRILADVIIDTTNLTPEKVCDAIIAVV